jgi:hypothetical protein
MSESLFSGESPSESAYSNRYSRPVYDSAPAPSYPDTSYSKTVKAKDIFDSLPSFNPATQSLNLINMVEEHRFLINQKVAITTLQSNLIDAIKQAILQNKSDIEFSAQFHLTEDAKVGGMASLNGANNALEQAYQSLLNPTFERLKEKGYLANLSVNRVDNLSVNITFPGLNLEQKKGFGNIL